MVTKEEAKQALLDGERVTHRLFTDDEWVKQNGHWCVYEDGVTTSANGFWLNKDDSWWGNDWSIFNDDK